MNFVIFTLKNMNKLLKKICNKKFRYLIYPLFFIIFSYLIIIISAEKIETSLIFPWWNKEENIQLSAPFDYENIDIILSQKEHISWIFIDNKSEKTIFYFQGNGWNLNYYYDDIQILKDFGYNVMALNYPWFWWSSLSPNRKNTQKYVEIFYSFIKKEKKIDNSDITIFAYSIGSWIALNFSKSHTVDKIILVAPLSSLFEMSIKEYGFILQKYLFLSERFDNKKNIKYIKSPLLIIHWDKDTLIPLEQGKWVYENAQKETSYFLEIKNIGHNLILQKYENITKWFLKIFLEKWKLEKKYYSIDENTKIHEIEKEKVIDPLEKIKQLDFISDFSLTKYVWVWTSFKKIDYIPDTLTKIQGIYIKDIKWWQMLRKEALVALDEMGKDFYTKFWVKIAVVSGYRSYLHQIQIKANACPDTLCSKPWYSEHQSGLAIDLWETTTEKEFLSKKELNSYFLWLKENAHLYWFHNSYQNGVEIDGYEKEPWHWRYIEKDLATYLYEKKISFSQFYKKINTKESKY